MLDMPRLPAPMATRDRGGSAAPISSEANSLRTAAGTSARARCGNSWRTVTNTQTYVNQEEESISREGVPRLHQVFAAAEVFLQNQGNGAAKARHAIFVHRDNRGYFAPDQSLSLDLFFEDRPKAMP